ncbi:hypothetical protein FHS29_004314 [Saccharothrix tamanrassetensis]|uniref:DUF3558 domain-containing protein n=1 Tax=Saccharothrix tamanrassetensis TaxID=1051531 RepID=A0A841CK98_9PSEU|nr:hypothetical protein [Saccharothrix tamanrassetensis]MBB5957719.1 hypothetical protein [Saccharothrix tamanrassetensis]
MTIEKALVAVLGLIVLAGCTSTPHSAPATGGTTPSTPATTPSEVAGISCAKAPEDVVGAALQLNLNHPRETINGTVVTCQYDGGGASTMVRFQTKSDAAAFAKGKEEFGGNGQKVKDLPDFHDNAYTGTLGTGEVVQNTLVARKGPVEILVTSGANFEQEKKLVTQLFERL